MIAPIAPISAIRTIPMLDAAVRVAAPKAPDAFASILKESVAAVEETRSSAKVSADNFLTGENEELHHVALEAQKAQLSFDLFMQVRNKVVTAYQEIMRMQV